MLEPEDEIGQAMTAERHLALEARRLGVSMEMSEDTARWLAHQDDQSSRGYHGIKILRCAPDRCRPLILGAGID